MTIAQASRELEPRDQRPIGWDGKRLDEMLAESERLFADSGAYAGLTGELERRDPQRGPAMTSAATRRTGRCTHPVVHDFLPDVEGFYRGWLGRELP